MLLGAALALPAVAQQRTLVTVDAGKTREPISTYMYGQFIEHLGDVINRGLWSEMLDDRKFFFPINSSEQEPKTPGLGMRAPRPGRANRWRPIGPDAAVTMDRIQPYVGEQTPRIELAGTEPRGIRQGGLALRKGKTYVGRVIAKGDAGTRLTIRMVGIDRHVITTNDLPRTYTKIPFQFTASADTDEGRLEITGTGTGTMYIGAASLMRADNVKGFRPETIALLKQLDSGFYRFPGGNFLSNHDWQDAIGDPDRRPPTWDYHWSAVQPNDVGTDEFMDLCGLLGVEPYITVNAGFGDARAAADWVEYANGSADTPFGKLRAANGHPEPYHIRYWNVGNEPYGWWQLGHMSLNQYVIKHNLFAQAMRKKDPNIVILAAGAMPDEMTVTTNSRRVTGKVLTEFGSDADWTGGLLAHSFDYLDALTEHWYCHSGTRFDLEVGQNGPLGTRAGFVSVEEPLVDWARVPPTAYEPRRKTGRNTRNGSPPFATRTSS
jgi:alpha-N-arabinofuranosidase